MRAERECREVVKNRGSIVVFVADRCQDVGMGQNKWHHAIQRRKLALERPSWAWRWPLGPMPLQKVAYLMWIALIKLPLVLIRAIHIKFATFCNGIGLPTATAMPTKVVLGPVFGAGSRGAVYFDPFQRPDIDLRQKPRSIHDSLPPPYSEV